MTRPTLLLLPGLMCDRAVWSEQIEALSPAFDCVVPHYGELDSLAAMAAKVLSEAPPGPLAVAGHSMGGRVAFEMVMQAPQRIERLALLDTSCHPLPPGEEGERERAGRHALLAIARAQGMRAMARAWAKDMVHPSRRASPVFEAVLDMFERGSPAALAAQIEALLGRRDATGLLAHLDLPTLLLCGREDGWSPPSRHEFMHQRIAGSRLVILEQCGHMSTMEQPAAVTAALADWLAAPGEPRAPSVKD
ncbi:alpha/beta hydrolase [uncultured Piscinibacter sp.]|uniref:alpha/beta fold hydrolase n=1 Tax=uncultured Piscinibacter sp. TaxID=1131835 RepID=UPI0026082A94|nr:alpha/beta hydrolase [uncultured Piscinibacter sp.]